MEDEGIWEEDEQGVHTHSAGHNKETIDMVDNDASADQCHDLQMQTVGMSEHMRAAIMKVLK